MAVLFVLIMGAASARALPDNRGWELVSPLDKNGGQISSPAEAGKGTFEAAFQGGAVAYASRASFANGAGAAPFSNYIATRSSGGWSTQNITPAQLAGAYEGAPYIGFTEDLARGLLVNPRRTAVCDPCPTGYRAIDLASGAVLASLADPADFEGAPPDPPAVPGGATFLAASADGSTVYYRIGNAIWRRRGGVDTQILVGSFGSALTDTSAVTSGATADGNRLYITTAYPFPSRGDVNLALDVYQWQTQGSGSCARAAGCVDLISSGLAGTSTFIGASADGADVFFTTDRSLVWNDPNSVDLYDARVGGGFPVPTEPPLCVGDACQSLPPAVEDPILTTTLQGPPNPRERYRSYGARARKKCPTGKRLKTVKRKNGKRVRKCVEKKAARKRGGRR